MDNGYLIFSSSSELLRLRAERIVYVKSDGNYSTLVMADGEERLVTCQLGEVERMMAAQLSAGSMRFVRIGKSLIINRTFIHYIHPVRQQLVLSDEQSFRYTLTASKEALRQLKNLVENTV